MAGIVRTKILQVSQGCKRLILRVVLHSSGLINSRALSEICWARLRLRPIRQGIDVPSVTVPAADMHDDSVGGLVYAWW